MKFKQGSQSARSSFETAFLSTMNNDTKKCLAPHTKYEYLILQFSRTKSYDSAPKNLSMLYVIFRTGSMYPKNINILYLQYCRNKKVV